ncbi:hypothetical protein AB0F46_41650 [Streptomyces sp. NPDC026665]|uniref:hypothetical protein n=1 Tax=Streptomyces sp. NPDC026665 TaxID=3154798 RepID=UPI0033E7C71E
MRTAGPAQPTGPEQPVTMARVPDDDIDALPWQRIDGRGEDMQSGEHKPRGEDVARTDGLDTLGIPRPHGGQTTRIHG